MQSAKHRFIARHRRVGHCYRRQNGLGQGYGREAVRLLVAYGFRYLNLYSIRLWVHGFNERARRAYLAAGFREAGRLRGATLFDGQRYDRILMEITRDDVR